jgi:hypothetical protein
MFKSVAMCHAKNGTLRRQATPGAAFEPKPIIARGRVNHIKLLA